MLFEGRAKQNKVTLGNLGHSVAAPEPVGVVLYSKWMLFACGVLLSDEKHNCLSNCGSRQLYKFSRDR